MKIRFPTSRLIQAGLALLLIAISLFAFFKTSFYQTLKLVIQFYCGIVEALVGVNPLAYLPRISHLIVLLVGFLGAAALIFGVGRERGWTRRFTGFLFLLSVPAILAFSHHKWWQVGGLTLQTELSFQTVLIISLILVTGHFALYYAASLTEWGRDLQRRGAGTKGVNKSYLRKSAFTLLVIILALLATGGVFFVSRYLQEPLTGLMASVPGQIFVIGIGISLAAALVLSVLLIKAREA